MKVQGKNVVIFIQQGTDWLLYACATSATLDVKTDVVETSVSGQGKFATFLPTKNSFTGILEGVTSLEEPGMFSLQELRSKQLAQELLKLRYQRSDGVNLYTEEGSFYITSSTDVGSFDGMNLFTINAQGTGALSEVASTPTPPAAFTFEYGATELDTVVTDGLGTLFPTEAQFLSSVDDAFTAGTEQTGTEPNTGDNIEVATFGNTTDKVVFVEYPSTEAVFTKWSIEGDPFQQNQPIDPAYTLTTGNLFFSSTRGSDHIIIAYRQTTFGGKLILSR